MSRWVILVAVLLAFAAAAAASDKQIRKVSTLPTSPASGQQMFNEYCAVCHGKDGKGAGPAASALKKMPSDLTELAAHNNGKFPERRVFYLIQGDSDTVAHGSKDMPVWGTAFRSFQFDGDPSADVERRVSVLNNYIASLQEK